MEKNYQEILLKLINQQCPLPSSLSELIAKQCRIVHKEKNQMITERGQQDTFEYFLLEGIIHRYTITEEGDLITTDFYLGPEAVMPNFVRTSDGKSIFSLQALTPVTLSVIDAAKLDEIKETYPEIRKWGQKVVEKKLKRNFVEEIRFRSNSARERLVHLRREFPNIENKIPHSCIASYVGVTPVSFSRLRKDLARPS